MTDLHVTDAIIVGSQRGFQAAVTHLEPVAQAVLRLDADPAGATAMIGGLAGQDGQLAVLLATVSQCLTQLAQDTVQAGQQFGSTDQALRREITDR
jgi:hypothetical protein